MRAKKGRGGEKKKRRKKQWSKKEREVLVVAGDNDRGNAAMVVPKGFAVPAILADYRAVAQRFRPRMRAALSADGWPAWVAERRGAKEVGRIGPP